MTQQEALQDFYDTHREYDVRANDYLLLNASTRPVTVKTLAEAAQRLGSVLATQQEFLDGWSEFVARRPEFGGVQGNRNVAFSLLGYGQPPSAETFEEMAAREACPFSFNAQYCAEQADTAERARLIQGIALGKSTYAYIRPSDGATVNYETKELDSETTERLREISDLMAAQRQLLAKDPKQWHAELRAAEVRRDQERIGMVGPEKTVPSTWTPSFDGQFSNTGAVIKAGVPVTLTREVFMRLNKDDMRKILNLVGPKVVDKFLGVNR